MGLGGGTLLGSGTSAMKVVGVAIDGARVLAPVWGGCSGVCLLFENCIVDASIFVDFVDRFVW